VGYTEQPNLVLEPSVMSMYPNGHHNLAKDPSVMPHYMSVLLIIRPKKPVMAQSLSLLPMMSLTPSEKSLYFSVHPMVSQNVSKTGSHKNWKKCLFGSFLFMT
jgi:hypothetical protein